MSHPTPTSPATVTPSFKGLALFTPGGDCVYCIDQYKRNHWHLDLCAALQQHLALAEPPYFLLPGFTATLDRWVDANCQEVITIAEAYPRALPFQSLLNVLFGLDNLEWQPNYTLHEHCSTWVIDSYRRVFPQLWESHNLILRVQAQTKSSQPAAIAHSQPISLETSPPAYQFKLFVSGADTLATEQMLRVLHTTLDTSLSMPYTLQLIDVLSHPNEAEAEHISATPTLIQVSPPPARRIVGRFPNSSQIHELLGNL